MGQASSSPANPPASTASTTTDSVRSRIRSSISSRLQHVSSTPSLDSSTPATPAPDRRRTSLLRRAQSSLNHIPTVFGRRAQSRARDSSSSLLLTPSASNNLNSSARHTLSGPVELALPPSPITTDNILDLNGSELHLPSRSASPAGRRRPLPRPHSILGERLASSLRAERLSRTVSNPLRRRRPTSTRGDDQFPVLSQLLSAAAAATAASLMGDDPNAVRNARGIGGDEGTLESFLESLQNGRMASALNRSTSSNNESTDEIVGPQGINFVRLFRFGSTSDSSGSHRTATQSAGGQGETSTGDDENSSEGRMVPIIIVGIRSINPSPSGQDEHTIPSFIDALTSFPDPLNTTELPVETATRQPQNGTRFSHRRRASMGGLGSYDNQRHQRTNDAPRPFSAATSETSFAPRPPPSTPASTGLSAFSSGTTTPTQPLPAPQLESPSTSPSRTGSLGRGNPIGLEPINTAEDTLTRRTARNRRMSESDFARFGSGSSRRNGVVEPDDAETTGARSWIIYVLGGSYPENHPLLNTPSLFTDSPTYEDMLLLSSLLGPAKPPVASEEDLASAPGLFRLKVGEYPGTIIGVADDTEEVISIGTGERCLVCLQDFEISEEVRRLMQCEHTFHKECIDQWLTTGRNSCPLCRREGIQKTNPEEQSQEPDRQEQVSQAV